MAACARLLLLPALGGAWGRVETGGGDWTVCICCSGGVMPLEEADTGPAIEEEAVELEQELERSTLAVTAAGRSERRSAAAAAGRGMPVAHELGGVL